MWYLGYAPLVGSGICDKCSLIYEYTIDNTYATLVTPPLVEASNHP